MNLLHFVAMVSIIYCTQDGHLYSEIQYNIRNQGFKFILNRINTSLAQCQLNILYVLYKFHYKLVGQLYLVALHQAVVHNKLPIPLTLLYSFIVKSNYTRFCCVTETYVYIDVNMYIFFHCDNGIYVFICSSVRYSGEIICSCNCFGRNAQISVSFYQYLMLESLWSA